MSVATTKLSLILFGLAQMLKFQRRRHENFRKRLKERNFVAQIMARDEEVGRWFEFKDGVVRSRSGLHPKPDCKLMFKTAAVGVELLMPPINWLRQINAQKDFVLTVDGPEDLTNWFAQTVMMSQSAGLKIGTPMPDGSMRYCNMTNGGPVFITVKDGKIIRMTPIDLTEDDGASWTIEAKGVKLTPPRKTTLAPHGQNAKSIIYSPDRLLFPMKRVDFDPNGERNPQNRGKSGYVRISWEEAIKLVTDEIKRQKRELWPRLHRDVARLASHLGQCRLLPLGAVPLRQRDRHDARAPQPRLLGRLVLGRGASLGLHAARRPVGDLRHGRGLSAELRHDRVLGGRSGVHVRLLWRAGRHRAPAVAQGSETRHQGRPYRSLLQRHRTVPAGQMVRAAPHDFGRDGDGNRLRLDQGRPLSQGIRRDPHRRFRQVEGLSRRRRGRHPEDAGVAGEGNRRSGEGRARARARVGHASASISRPAAGATATAAPAATRPASSGRA